MRNLSKILATASVGVVLVLAIVGSVFFATSHKAGPWIDTTDVVALQGAKGLGRQVATPLINTDQGHMLVFFFTLAGVAAGSAIGYYWRKLMLEKGREPIRGQDKAPIIGGCLVVVLMAIAAHEAWSATPFIDPNLGDVKLFAFISMGTVIGFVHGYLWRRFKAQKQGVQGLAG
jgi:membrane protease YdiL (CAAX protease family)